jgi:hypothetical protein
VGDPIVYVADRLRAFATPQVGAGTHEHAEALEPLRSGRVAASVLPFLRMVGVACVDARRNGAQQL